MDGNSRISLNNNSISIILSLALYFGWLLSFPFYGPVLTSISGLHPTGGLNLGLAFVSSHAVFLFLGGFFLHSVSNWKKLMLLGLVGTIVIYMLFLMIDPLFWTAGMILLGTLSAIYILGWSCIYSMAIPSVGRINKMAAIIIIANIIFVVINTLSEIFSPFAVMLFTFIPLLTCLRVVFSIPESLKLDNKIVNKENTSLPIPLILICCFFVAGLYLNGGFMYNIMAPNFEKGLPFFNNYRYIPYIIVLLIMFKYGEKVKRYLPVYMGVTLMGMSFVSFALLEDNIIGAIITLGLVEAAFAFLDLFLWTALGELALIYGAPYQFFGLILGSMVASILAGDVISIQILQVGETHQLVTAIFAAAAIFLTYLVIPWLNQRMDKDFTHLLSNGIKGAEQQPSDNIQETILNKLRPDQSLTPREIEITILILKGLKNREIAGQLFISENTLKSHLKNIYPKFGVTQKRELLSIALSAKRKK